MKKISLILVAIWFAFSAKATIFISNYTSCTYILSIGGGGGPSYFEVPPGIITYPSTVLISGMKIAYWPGFSTGGSIISEDFVTSIGSGGSFTACTPVNWVYSSAGGINTNLLIMP